MKRMIILLVLLAAAGCSSPQTLKMRHYSKNIVIRADNSIVIDGKMINFKKLRHELISRMIFEQTPITLHFHRDVSKDIFDVIVNGFKKEGFCELSYTVYDE